MKTRSLSLALPLLALAAVSSAQNPVTYRYSQDLSALALATPGLDGAGRTMYLDLQLTDGSQLGNGTTTVTLTNFRLTGGTFGAPLGNIGGVSEPTPGVVELRDNVASINGLADYARAFTVPIGAVAPRLEFDFTVKASTFDTPSDYFFASLLISDFTSVTTTGTVGSEQGAYRVTNGATPEAFTTTTTYGAERAAAGDPRFLTLARPTITVAPVPEPATFAALGVGLAALARRRKRA